MERSTDKRSTSTVVADLIRNVCGMHCVVRYGLATDPSEHAVHVPTSWAVRTRSIRSHVASERAVICVDGTDHVVLDSHAIPRRELAPHEHAWRVVLARRSDDGLTVASGVIRLAVGERSPRAWTLASGLAETRRAKVRSLPTTWQVREIVPLLPLAAPVALSGGADAPMLESPIAANLAPDANCAQGPKADLTRSARFAQQAVVHVDHGERD